jgi:hypothetical protein
MARVQRTAEELASVATEHLCHTVEMFRAAAYQLSLNRKDKLTNHLLLEALEAHAGALVHFLFPDANFTADDVLAEDFFDSSDAWHSIRGTFPRSLAGLRGLPVGQCVRLTYRDWATPETNGWNVNAIAGSLHSIIDTFIASAPKLDPHTSERLAHTRYMTCPVIR